jgi:hypothetical protein
LSDSKSRTLNRARNVADLSTAAGEEEVASRVSASIALLSAEPSLQHNREFGTDRGMWRLMGRPDLVLRRSRARLTNASGATLPQTFSLPHDRNFSLLPRMILARVHIRARRIELD